jgi:hypothetical protein
VKIRIEESYPGELDTRPDVHEAISKALRKALPRGAEWDVVEELSKAMRVDYEERMKRLQDRVREIAT